MHRVRYSAGVHYLYPVGYTVRVSLGCLTSLTSILIVPSFYISLSRTPIPWPVVWIYGHFKILLSLFVRWVGSTSLHILHAKHNKEQGTYFIHLEFALAESLGMELHCRAGEKPVLESILSFNDATKTIRCIAENLHYADIISLTRTSKIIRRLIYSPPYRSSNLELIGVSSCENGSKRECWCCGMQICKVYLSSLLRKRALI